MTTLSQIVELLSSGEISTGEIVQVDKNGNIEKTNSFRQDPYRVNVQIGFNTVGVSDVDLSDRFNSALQESLNRHLKYFPRT